MRKFTTLLALMAATVSAAAPAELTDYATIGTWAIYSDDHDCTLAGQYDGNGSLGLDYDSRKDDVTIRFKVPQTTSLGNGDSRAISTVFTNGTVKSMDFGWGTHNFTAFTVNNQTYLTFVFKGQFLDDLASHKTLAFFYDDVLLFAFDLSDSARAVELLRACANKRSRANPSDPFDDGKASTSFSRSST